MIIEPNITPEQIDKNLAVESSSVNNKSIEKNIFLRINRFLLILSTIVFISIYVIIFTLFKGENGVGGVMGMMIISIPTIAIMLISLLIEVNLTLKRNILILLISAGIILLLLGSLGVLR